MHVWAAARDPAAAGHPLPAPYSVRTLLDELRMPPVVHRDGELVEVEPLSDAGEHDFPPPIGHARAIYTLHSELATLPAAFPTLREASFRLSLPERLVEGLLSLPDGEEPEPYTQSPEAIAAHVVEVAAADGPSVVATALTSGGSARSTAEPAARAAVELSRGALSARGVLAPEAAIPDPETFLAKLDTEVSFILR
jgi:saccharopine dehydrogenase-like NADP-dependent oxidoreductase